MKRFCIFLANIDLENSWNFLHAAGLHAVKFFLKKKTWIIICYPLGSTNYKLWLQR